MTPTCAGAYVSSTLVSGTNLCGTLVAGANLSGTLVARANLYATPHAAAGPGGGGAAGWFAGRTCHACVASAACLL